MGCAAAPAELCGQYDSASVSGGAYIVQNDHWNPDSTGQQCKAVGESVADPLRYDSVTSAPRCRWDWPCPGPGSAGSC